MRKGLIYQLPILLLVAAVISGCTKYFDPESKFEDYEQEVEKTVKRKVLLISVDGLVGKVLEQHVPQNIQGLIDKGKYSFGAVTDENTSDAATWTTMLTGYPASEHHVLDNNYLPSPNSDDPHGEINFSPSVVYRLEDQMPSLRTSAVLQDEGLANVLLMDADDNVLVASDDRAKDEAIAVLNQVSPDLLIVQFKDVLTAGVLGGFSEGNVDYLNAIDEVDAKIGEIINAVGDRDDTEYENWLFIVTSNHGGIDNSYGGGSYAERNIFTVYSHDDFISQELNSDMMSAVRLWGYSSSPLGIRAVNTEADASEYFNIDSSGELTIQVRYKWASPKTVEWSKNNTPIGDNTFWYAPMVSKKVSVNDGQVGWGFYSWNQNIAFGVSDGSKGLSVQSARGNGEWAVITGRIRKLENGDAEVAIFNDGVMAETKIIPNFNFSAANDNPFVLGYANTILYELPDFNVSNLRIWKRGLSDNEIRENACINVSSDVHLQDEKMLGDWDISNATTDHIANLKDSGKSLYFEGITPSFLTEEAFTPCEKDPSEVLLQNLDVTQQIFYWLEMKPHEAWNLRGKVFLSAFELEFLK